MVGEKKKMVDLRASNRVIFVDFSTERPPEPGRDSSNYFYLLPDLDVQLILEVVTVHSHDFIDHLFAGNPRALSPMTGDIVDA